MRIISCHPNHICLVGVRVRVFALKFFVVVIVVFIHCLLPANKYCATLTHTVSHKNQSHNYLYIHADSFTRFRGSQ